MRIHKEGFKIISGTTLLCAIFIGVPALLLPGQYNWINWIFISLAVTFFLIILQFFRVPERNHTIDANAIVSPADGKVVVIEEVFEKEYLKTNCKQISVFMSPINVHVNRAPISGLVTYFKYHKGKYLVAWHPKSSEENERTTVVIKNSNGTEILFRQIAGALAKRIVWYVKEGVRIDQTDEFGFIKFGSRVDIFIPLTADVKVNLQQKVKGGVTILAELNEKTNA